MAIPICEKAPGEVLKWSRDYTPHLEDTDVIIESSWSATGDLVVDSNTFDGLITTVWVSGGTLNTGYDLTNTIETAAGATIVRTIRIVCVPR